MKILVITNHSYMFWQFRRELMARLLEEHEVVLSTPFVGHEEDLKALGCRLIETEVDRRGINPVTDSKLIRTYAAILKQKQPDLVITYSIKPQYLCRLSVPDQAYSLLRECAGTGHRFSEKRSRRPGDGAVPPCGKERKNRIF